MTSETIIEYAGDIKFMQKLERTIAGLSSTINPIKNLIRKDIYNADIYILEAIAILDKKSNLTKSEREAILNVIEFTIDEYEQWKSGESTSGNK